MYISITYLLSSHGYGPDTYHISSHGYTYTHVHNLKPVDRQLLTTDTINLSLTTTNSGRLR
jgi:hypothetical protein